MKDKSTKSVLDKVWMIVKKNVLVSASLLFVAILLVVTVVIVTVTGIKDKAAEKRAYEALSEEEKALLNQDFTVGKDAYDFINEDMTAYLNALADNNQEYIKTHLSDVTLNELDNIEVKSKYVSKYDDIVVYTQNGINEDSYYVYVTCNIYYEGYNTPVPSISGVYYAKDENGEYKIYKKKNSMPPKVVENFYIACMQPEVQEIYNQTSIAYNQAIDSDENLKAFVLEYEDMKKKDLSAIVEERDRLAREARKAAEELEQQSQVATVKTTTSVNVRKSDSETSERLGTVGDGVKLQRLEEKRNGWSKVQYEGQEAYIKSEYLVVVDEDGNEVASNNDNQNDNNTDNNQNNNEAKKYVTATDNVNIREEADIDSERVGFAYNGDKFELVEKLSNGWTKIKYNGKDAYVKSDYVK